ncbi:MAG: hypothetical protein Q9202_005018 [Teloschistes flavicans]
MRDPTVIQDLTALHVDAPAPKPSIDVQTLASKESFPYDLRSIEENHHPISSNFDEASLPPQDGGKDAWFFLAACFVVEALVWDYYSNHDPFKGSGNIAVIGTCAMGIMYLDLPIVFGLLRRYPSYQRLSTTGGLLVMCFSLGLSSLSQNTTHLIITQGVFYAIGGSFAYSPCILFIDEWFNKRKGLAYGIMWAGTGLAGVVLPLVMQWLLNTYGFRTTLRVWAISLFLLTGPLLYFVKPRIPNTPAHFTRARDFAFILTSTFGVLQACNIIEALGFFLPTIYLPSFARSLGASSTLGALTVILFNVASVFGCVLMGAVVDKWHVTNCILVSTIGSTIGIFVVWGFSISLPPLYIFSLIYGLFAGSFTSTWPGIMRDVKKRRDNADSSMIFACLAAGRGVGNVASGPLSEALIHGFPWKGSADFAYGSGYGPLIVFTGLTAFFGGSSILGRRIGWL